MTLAVFPLGPDDVAHGVGGSTVFFNGSFDALIGYCVTSPRDVKSRILRTAFHHLKPTDILRLKQTEACVVISSVTGT